MVNSISLISFVCVTKLPVNKSVLATQRQLQQQQHRHKILAPGLGTGSDTRGRHNNPNLQHNQHNQHRTCES